MPCVRERFHGSFYGLRQSQFISDVLLKNCYIKLPRNWYAIISPAAVTLDTEAYFWELPFSHVCNRRAYIPTRRLSRSPATREAKLGLPALHRSTIGARTTAGNTKSVRCSLHRDRGCAVVFFVFLFTFRLPSRVLCNIQSKLFVERGIVSFRLVHNYCFNFFSVSRSPLPPRARKSKKIDSFAQFYSIFQFTRVEYSPVRIKTRFYREKFRTGLE